MASITHKKCSMDEMVHGQAETVWFSQDGLTSLSMQASTSELFGKVQEIPQKETTPFYPRSPYGKN